jgi:hypothetical protein
MALRYDLPDEDELDFADFANIITSLDSSDMNLISWRVVKGSGH